jgi:hypothetical protein
VRKNSFKYQTDCQKQEVFMPIFLFLIFLLSFPLNAIEYTSQFGQDKWEIEEVFRFKPSCFFVDIGAADGKYISNTYCMEKSLNWKSICIEPISPKYRALLENVKNMF